MSICWSLALVLYAALSAACGGGSGPSSPTSPTPTPSTSPPSSAFVLTGDWVRANSTFAELDGMVVRVSADSTQALIISTPANPYQFRADDVKWRRITRVSDTRFSFEDLVRQSGSGAMSYVSGFIDARPGGTELSMTFPTTGTEQQWRRR